MKESSKKKWDKLEEAVKIGKRHIRTVHWDENGDPIYIEATQLKVAKRNGITEVIFFEAIDLTKE